MNRKSKFFTGVVTLSLLLILTASVTFAAPAPKVDVCHYDAEYGIYKLINISENAFPAHLDHGDASPGDLVPGMPNKMFGADCSLLDVNANVAGTWMGASGRAGNLAYPFYMYLNQDAAGYVTGTIYYYNHNINRTVTGSVAGNDFTFRTHANPSDPTQAYWADCSPCTVSTDGTYFHGYGYDSGGTYVEFQASK